MSVLEECLRRLDAASQTTTSGAIEETSAAMDEFQCAASSNSEQIVASEQVLQEFLQRRLSLATAPFDRMLRAMLIAGRTIFRRVLTK